MTGVAAAGVLAAGCLLAGAGPAAAQPVVYAAVTAAGSGSCADPADACTLSTALGQVAAGGTVQLVTSGDTARYVGNWTVSTASTSASQPVTIDPLPGLGSAPILDGDGPNAPAGETCSTASCTGPVLTVPAGEFAAITGITIADGNGNSNTSIGDGGGLLVSGTATVTGSTFTGNTAFSGGAIDSGDGLLSGTSTGTVTVTGSTFTGNTGEFGGAIGGGFGGSGSVSVTGSTFSGNSATQGGAIESGADGGAGTVTITDSTFSSNSATNYGGVIDSGDNGGGGLVSVTGSTFSGNSANRGGAIDSGFAGGGSVSVTGSTFSGNTASFNGGAIDSADNGGGGSVSVTTSTFSGNTAEELNGGAIDSGDDGGTGSVSVTASTFTGNTAGFEGGSIDGGDDGGGGSVSVAADVFADSCARPGGTWDDGGYNAGSDGTCFAATPATGDVNAGSVAALDLGSLASNGGPTQTVQPQPGSPVIGMIPDPTTVTLGGNQVALCPATDQRGYASSPGSACDAGAVQTTATGSLALAVSSPTSGFSQAGDVISVNYQVTNTGTTPLAQISVDDPAVPHASCPDSSLAPGTAETCTGSYTVTNADVRAGKVTDTTTSTGATTVGGAVTSNSSTVVVERVPWPAGVSGSYRPAAGAAEGYYLSVTGNRWDLLVTHPGSARVSFTGTVTINSGKFSSLTPVSLGTGGSVGISGRTLSFTVYDHGNIGGIAFGATLPTSITFTLDIGGQPATATQIYLGGTPTQSTSPSPLTFTR